MTLTPEVLMEIAALNECIRKLEPYAARDGMRWPSVGITTLRREIERISAEAPLLRFWRIATTQWCVGQDTLTWPGAGLQLAYEGIQAYQSRDPAPPLHRTPGQARMALARGADAVADKNAQLAQCIRAVRAHRGALVYRPPSNAPTLALNPSS